MYGWTGTILRVDLSSGDFRRETLDKSLYHHFLGGRGINSKLLYSLTGPETEPLDPDAVLIFGTGPFAGTLTPSSPRCTVTAKSPLTVILRDANFGGFSHRL